jgi:DNA polymerase-3 subunit delta'
LADLFADLIGQPQAVALLEAALRRRRLAPAYLFAGPEGVGRRLAALRFLEGLLALPAEGEEGDAGAGAGEGSTPLAGDPTLRRRLAQGNHPDLLWVEPTFQHQGRLVPASQADAEGVNRRAAPQLRLEQVREVSRFLARRPVEAPGCLVVLDGAEAMAEAAANALLKTLEEPGTGRLILICAAPDQLLATIRSRCQQVPFARLSVEQVAAVLAGLPAAGVGEEPSELLELAAGSPGALLRHRARWRELPEGLAARMLALDPDPLQALGLARDLSEALDAEQQLWLLDWWQLALWRRLGRAEPLRRLERLRSQLRAYVQPRLAWEVALLQISGLTAASGGRVAGR